MSNKLKISFYLIFTILFLPLITNSAEIDLSQTDLDIRSEIIQDPRVQALINQDPINPTQILKLIENLENEKNPPNDSPIKLESTIEDDEPLDGKKTFWMVTDFYSVTYSQVSATLLSIGTNCYIYVADSIISTVGTSNARTRADEWKAEFESQIYPNNLLYYGTPDGYLGDIDGDSHVTVFLAPLSADVAGYFDPNNERSGSTSNTREMVYVDYDYNRYSVLAHELQHLTHYNYDPDEYWWIDEGLAEFSAYLDGYALDTNLTEFARDYFQSNPEDSLLYWNYYDYDNDENVRSDYGGAYMFIFYFAEKYGSDAVRNLIAETAGGPLSVETTLDALGHSIDFNDLYLNWITAMVVDDPTIDGGIYGFENLDINLDYDLNSVYPTTKTNKLHRFYGIYIAKMTSPPDYLLMQSTTPGSYALGISAAVHDINGWSVQKSIQSSDIELLINGTIIDTIYIMTSIMTPTTPSIPLADTSQFGLGYTDDLDFTYIP